MSDVVEYLLDRPEYIEVLERALEWERENKKEDSSIVDDTPYDTFWEVSDIRANPQKLYQLFTKGLIDRVYKSNNYTYYALTDRNEVEEVIEQVDDHMSNDTVTSDPDDVVMHSFPTMEELDDGIFDSVIGYDDVKWILKRGITTDKITNFLLLGEKGTAKSVFLLALQRHFDQSRYIVASEASSPGVLNVLFDELPMFFLVDEFDDMKKEHQAVFSSYAETGILSETKSGKNRQIETNIKTFAAANDRSKIKDNIFDRFTPIKFERYTESEFKEICVNMLPEEEGKTVEESEAISDAIWDYRGYGDVRAAIQVARLSRGDPQKVVQVLENYSNSPTQSLVEQA